MKENNNSKTGKKLNKKGIIAIIIAIIVILVVIGIVVGINTKKKQEKENIIKEAQSNLPEGSKIDLNNLENAEIQDNVKVNNSEKAHNEKEYQGLKFSNLVLNSENGETNFVVNIINTNSSKSEEKYVKIVCLDKDGNTIGELYILVTELEAGASITASAVTEEDYVNLYDFRVEGVETNE